MANHDFEVRVPVDSGGCANQAEPTPQKPLTIFETEEFFGTGEDARGAEASNSRGVALCACLPSHEPWGGWARGLRRQWWCWRSSSLARWRGRAMMGQRA
jgi:hypothetical protein